MSKFHERIPRAVFTGQHYFATCHLGEVHGSALHSELLPVKCTLRDEQLPFPAVVQLEPGSQLLWAVNQSLCTPEGSDQPQVWALPGD